MEEIQRERESGHAPTESPLTTPPARLREPSADDLPMDVSDSTSDILLDDSDRLYEDAEPLKD